MTTTDVSETGTSAPSTWTTGPSSARPPLLVAVLDEDTTQLVQAAGRAIAERRPLLVAVLREPSAWTVDAAVAMVSARRRTADVETLINITLATCGGLGLVPHGVVVLRCPWRPSQRARDRATHRALRRVATRWAAELHPSVGPAVDPGDDNIPADLRGRE